MGARDEKPPGSGPTASSWWDSNKLLIAGLGALGAAVAPITAMVSAKHERELKEEEWAHTVRMEFFQNVVNPSYAMTPDARLGALRYFQAVLPPGDLRKWAEIEHRQLDVLIMQHREAEAKKTQMVAKMISTQDEMQADVRRFEEIKERGAPASDLQAVEQALTDRWKVAKELDARTKKVNESLAQLEQKIAASMPRVDDAKKAPSADLEATHTKPAHLALKLAASRRVLFEKDDQTISRYAAWIDADRATLARIAHVDYIFDHPTFPTKRQRSTDQSTGFRVQYDGWGCLANVEVNIELIDGSTAQRSFDMCAALAASR